jgi:hypothetical protein
MTLIFFRLAGPAVRQPLARASGRVEVLAEAVLTQKWRNSGFNAIGLERRPI